MTLRYLPRAVLARRRVASGDTGDKRAEDLRWRETVAALADGRLELFVQPIASLGDGGCAGLETLVRVPPSDVARAGDDPSAAAARSLIPDAAADDGADVAALNAWLVCEAGAALSRWWDGLEPRLGTQFVSVSVDGRYLADENFLASVKDAVRTAGINADNLMLSVDASPGFDRLWSKLQRLKSHGVRVALEDFALGSQATDMLRRFSFDAVRISAPSAIELADDDGNELRAAIKLAHNLGCDVIVDGVDSESQRELLHWLGADLGLGDFLGPAQPAGRPPFVLEGPDRPDLRRQTG